MSDKPCPICLRDMDSKNKFCCLSCYKRSLELKVSEEEVE